MSFERLIIDLIYVYQASSSIRKIAIKYSSHSRCHNWFYTFFDKIYSSVFLLVPFRWHILASLASHKFSKMFLGVHSYSVKPNLVNKKIVMLSNANHMKCCFSRLCICHLLHSPVRHFSHQSYASLTDDGWMLIANGKWINELILSNYISTF